MKFPRKAFARHPALAAVKHVFDGVEIRPKPACACLAVQSMEGHRFLSDEAPVLPLASCETPQACRCVYEHFTDRRTVLRRDSDAGLPPRSHPTDRRRRAARRITDD